MWPRSWDVSSSDQWVPCQRIHPPRQASRVRPSSARKGRYRRRATSNGADGSAHLNSLPYRSFGRSSMGVVIVVGVVAVRGRHRLVGVEGIEVVQADPARCGRRRPCRSGLQQRDAGRRTVELLDDGIGVPAAFFVAVANDVDVLTLEH